MLPFLFRLLLIGAALSFGRAESGSISEHIPDVIESEGRYVFYSHGYIVEGDDPEPVHPRWGKYEFPAIKQSLAKDADFHLIAHHRPANVDFNQYVRLLTAQVRRLISSGVSPSNITLIGFSRGGNLTVHAAERLHNNQLNIVLLGTCNPSLLNKDLHLYGRILSVYEKSDGAKSCRKLAKAAKTYSSFKEVEIHTGLEHGAFYRPIPEWMKPLKSWLRD
jgi:dienelactone hydrolase